MMRITLLLLAVTAVVVTAGAASESPYRLLATVQEIMTVFTVPQSDVIFNVSAEPPKDDEGWQNIQNSALILAESGNLLLLPGRVPAASEEWTKQSEALIDAAIMASRAAREKNADNLAEAGNKLYDSCTGCHEKYMDKSK
jgi:cytochrome c553